MAAGGRAEEVEVEERAGSCVDTRRRRQYLILDTVG